MPASLRVVASCNRQKPLCGRAGGIYSPIDALLRAVKEICDDGRQVGFTRYSDHYIRDEEEEDKRLDQLNLWR